MKWICTNHDKNYGDLSRVVVAAQAFNPRTRGAKAKAGGALWVWGHRASPRTVEAIQRNHVLKNWKQNTPPPTNPLEPSCHLAWQHAQCLSDEELTSKLTFSNSSRASKWSPSHSRPSVRSRHHMIWEMVRITCDKTSPLGTRYMAPTRAPERET